MDATSSAIAMLRKPGVPGCAHLSNPSEQGHRRLQAQVTHGLAKLTMGRVLKRHGVSPLERGQVATAVCIRDARPIWRLALRLAPDTFCHSESSHISGAMNFLCIAGPDTDTPTPSGTPAERRCRGGFTPRSRAESSCRMDTERRPPAGRTSRKSTPGRLSEIP